MHDRPSAQGQPHLTDSQRTRIDFARRDLAYARAEDLEQLPEAGLVLLIDKLRDRLDDTLRIVDELTNPGGAHE